jgi:hypothetical protein
VTGETLSRHVARQVDELLEDIDFLQSEIDAAPEGRERTVTIASAVISLLNVVSEKERMLFIAVAGTVMQFCGEADAAERLAHYYQQTALERRT